MKTVSTYTIAYDTDSGMLLACVPDNTTDDIYTAIDKIEKEAGIDIDRDCVQTEEGLILSDEAPNGADVRFRTGISGRLSDENGVDFLYAIKT